jgi:hypothetical protein
VDEVRIRCIEQQWVDKFNEHCTFFDWVNALVGIEAHTRLAVEIIHTVAD